MSEEIKNSKCDGKVEVYQRVTGFFRPVQTYNKGKQEEFKDRVYYREGIV